MCFYAVFWGAGWDFPFFTLLPSSFWTSRGHRYRPFPPRFLPSIFIAHRVQQFHCPSIFHRVLLTHALALSASQFVHKKKSLRIYTSMHSGGFELTKLTYTGLEDNLICHRGDRLERTGCGLGLVWIGGLGLGLDWSEFGWIGYEFSSIKQSICGEWEGAATRARRSGAKRARGWLGQRGAGIEEGPLRRRPRSHTRKRTAARQSAYTLTSRHSTPDTESRQHRSGPSGSVSPSCCVDAKNERVFCARTMGRDVRYTTCAPCTHRSAGRQKKIKSRVGRAGRSASAQANGAIIVASATITTTARAKRNETKRRTTESEDDSLGVSKGGGGKHAETRT